jgi:hypothetical protein
VWRLLGKARSDKMVATCAKRSAEEQALIAKKKRETWLTNNGACKKTPDMSGIFLYYWLMRRLVRQMRRGIIFGRFVRNPNALPNYDEARNFRSRYTWRLSM